jgi:hypothetical protein
MKTNQQINPGMCPQEGCPSPNRIECINVEKVYGSCFQEEIIREEIKICKQDFSIDNFTMAQKVPCELVDIFCEEVERAPLEGGLSSVTLLFYITIKLINPNCPKEYKTKTITFLKTVTLCCPEDVFPDCTESSLTCRCVITNCSCCEVTVACNLKICLIIKCIKRVQLLVPSYGFCVPAPCITLPGVCPQSPPEQCF